MNKWSIKRKRNIRNLEKTSENWKRLQFVFKNIQENLNVDIVHVLWFSIYYKFGVLKCL